MAETEARPPPTDQPAVPENDERKLKYLDFVQVAALYVLVYCLSLYESAKRKSGPLRPGIQTVEGTVKSIVAPAYEKFQHVPFHLLKFVDRKVDDSMIKLDHHVPPLLKEVSRQARVAALCAPEVARELASEVRRSGLTHTASKAAKTAYVKYEPTAKELYVKYEPVAEEYAVAAWELLNRLPLFAQVACIMVPTAGYWAKKYNEAVAYGMGNGYTVSNYLPVVPIERIARTFEGRGNKPAAGSANGPCVAAPH